MLFDQWLHRIVPAPERKVLNPVLFILQNLCFEFRHMVLSPVVGHATHAKSGHHLSPRGRSALLRIEWNNAPCNQTIAVKVFRVRRCLRGLY